MDIKLDTSVGFLDIFIILVLLWAIYKGYKRGPMVHAVSLLIIVVGIALFGIISENIADYIRDRATVSLNYLHLFVFAVFFLITIWISHMVSNRIEKGGANKKGFVNIILGILASSIKYLYILSIVLSFFSQIDKSYDVVGSKERKRSKFYETVKSIAPYTIKTVSYLE
jgi:membrane protein required for colicin V production